MLQEPAYRYLLNHGRYSKRHNISCCRLSCFCWCILNSNTESQGWSRETDPQYKKDHWKIRCCFSDSLTSFPDLFVACFTCCVWNRTAQFFFACCHFWHNFRVRCHSRFCQFVQLAPNIFSSLSLGNYARILIFFGQIKPGCRVLFLCISSPQMWFYHSLIFVNVMCSRELKLLLVSDAWGFCFHLLAWLMTIPKVCCVNNITFDQAVFLTIIHMWWMGGETRKTLKPTVSFYFIQ